MDKFVEDKSSPSQYELSGIIFFDLEKKKYNALCVSPIDKMWYLFDDENVELSKFDESIYSYNKNKKYQPCALLYNNIDNNN